MNLESLLAIAEQHITLNRPSARAHPDHIHRNRAKFGYARNLLRSFAAFWAAGGCIWPITSGLVLDWVSEGAKPDKPYRDANRFFVIAGFLRRLRILEPMTEVPENIFRKPPRRNPRLLSEAEVLELMEATGQLRSSPPFRRLTLATLLGLLASTGLRVGEALRLNVDDVHLDADPPHLAIYETKFGKSRIVVLHSSTAERLRQYGEQRASALSSVAAAAFFASRAGKPLRYNPTYTTFQRVIRHSGISCQTGERTVTFHSLRHSFAVSRLTTWHQAGSDVSQLLPHLAVYLGHLDPRDTYWYVTATTELLSAASARFESSHGQGR